MNVIPRFSVGIPNRVSRSARVLPSEAQLDDARNSRALRYSHSVQSPIEPGIHSHLGHSILCNQWENTYLVA